MHLHLTILSQLNGKTVRELIAEFKILVLQNLTRDLLKGPDGKSNVVERSVVGSSNVAVSVVSQRVDALGEFSGTFQTVTRVHVIYFTTVFCVRRGGLTVLLRTYRLEHTTYDLKPSGPEGKGHFRS